MKKRTTKHGVMKQSGNETWNNESTKKGATKQGITNKGKVK